MLGFGGSVPGENPDNVALDLVSYELLLDVT